MKTILRYALIVCCIFTLACDPVAQSTENKKQEIKDPLPSWNDGETKSAILEFVKGVTDEASSTYLVPADRIATFDNDGTLWSEQPMYFQLAFALDQIKKLAPEHPEWEDTEPFKSVLAGDMAAVMKQGEMALLQIVLATHGGMSAKAFEYQVSEWMRTATHPKFNRPYTDLIYQPMLELLNYLRANEFKTFIVSGGGIGFMRPVTAQLYGIPPEQVMGSMMKIVYDEEKKEIMRLPELSFIDDKSGKPEGIYNFIGKKPIAAFGNSDGDLQMLEYTSANENAFLMYVHHTDATREWAYDSLSHIGNLKKGLKVANELGWTVVDMKNDWKVIYPFELNK